VGRRPAGCAWLIAWLALVLPGAGSASAAPAPDPAVRELLVEQHAPELVAAITTLALGLAEAEAPAGAADDWRARIARAFDADALFAGVLARASADWDARRAASISAFQATPVGARVLAAESRVLRALPAELEAFMAEQARSPAPPARLELLRRLDRATGTSALYVEAARMLRRGLRRASGAPQASEADEAAARARLEAASLGTALFAFRELSMAELATYVGFCESADARWLQRTLASAVLAEVADATTAFEAGLSRR
jgi:hypothetical protein